MVEITKNKHIYAAYYNMAQHNFFMTLAYVCKCLGMGDDVDEHGVVDIIIKNLSIAKKKDLKLKIYELLRKHLPFLVPMSEDVISSKKAQNEIDAFCFLLPEISKVLNFYRNYTTHFDSDEDDEIADLHLNERNLVPCLQNLFKASIRMVQQRFGYEEREVSFIKNKDIGKENFKYCLYKKELISATNSKPTSILSFRGLVFFISLFLEKKYISEMLAKTNAFYTEQDLRKPKRKSIVFETLSVYRIQLPRQRYDSEQEQIGLALDMVNELQRCPKELFDLLSVSDQNLFRSTEKSDDDPNTMLMLRHRDRFAQLALSYIDQQKAFPSIRFQIALGKYRFAFYDKKCIDVAGSDVESRVRSLQKELHGFGRLDEIEKDRTEKWASLIRDIENVKQDSSDSTPYITDHHASYLIRNNRVGLYWRAGRDDPQPGLPTLTSDPQAKDLRQRKKGGEEIARLTSPKCFMSTHELPALVFYHMLYKTISEEDRKLLSLLNPEKVIKNWAESFKKFINLVANGEVNSENVVDKAKELGIDYDKQVPKKLQEYLGKAGGGINEKLKQKLQARLEAHIEETQHLIERLKRDLEAVADKRNRRGTRKFVEIKSGRLGFWLAHDIIAVQPTPSEGYSKLTGLNFQILQASLSVYDDFDSLKRILCAAHLISHDDAHPFLSKVVSSEPKSTVAFYKKYLEEKLIWLQSIANNDLHQYAFLTRGVNKWAERNDGFYQRVIQQYLALPVELPRGLFEIPIKSILAHKLGVAFVKGSRRDDANVAFLIDKYFKQMYQDENQEFYTQPDGSYKRHYGFFKLLEQGDNYGKTISEIDYFLRNDTSLTLLNGAVQDEEYDAVGEKVTQRGMVQAYLEDKENVEQERQYLSRALHKLRSTERLIRRYKVQDIIIFLMARDILFNHDKELFNNRFDVFKLKNIRPIRRQDGVGALEISVPFSITLRIKGCSVPVVIRQESIKLKNYGDFHKFLNDSRIATLIPYLIDDESAVRLEIDRCDLEREFERYDHVRPEVFENVHRIERLILERHQELKDKSSPNYYYYDDKGKQKARRTSFGQMIQYSGAFSEEEGGDMVNIRDSFSHNGYIGRKREKVRISTTKIGEIAPALSDKIKGRDEQIKKKD